MRTQSSGHFQSKHHTPFFAWDTRGLKQAMKWTRREFVGAAGLLALAGCARVKQSRIGKLAPDLDFRKEGPLRFAALNDLHLLDSRSVGIVGRAVNAINNDEDIAFTVVLGDLTSHGTLREMNLVRHALGRLEKPYFCIPGPHDLAVGTEDPYTFYRRVFKKSQWKMNMEGWAFLGVDTCGGREESLPMSESNLEWFDIQLAHLDPKRPLVVLTHHPLAPGFEGRLANADDVLSRLEPYNVKLVLSGHYHGSQVTDHAGAVHITTPCCSTVAQNSDGTAEKGFRRVVLDEGQIQHEFVPVPT